MDKPMNKLQILKPDDWHLHFRDGVFLNETVTATAKNFQRAVAMPNLTPPVTTAALAMSYKQRILDARPKGSTFEPLVTLYLSGDTSPDDIKEAKAAGVLAAKLYPAGATTNSKAAVKSIFDLKPVFAEMAEQKMLLLIHGEVTTPEVDIFDREKAFIDQYLSKIADLFPTLKIVFEHVTTKDAVDFVLKGSDNLAATVTPQHLMLNRNHLLVGGIKPHYYCLPVLKRNVHQEALRKVVASGSKKFFLGTDSAPHEKSEKESACGCAGCYTAPAAIELYAHVFDEMNALDKLEGFASKFGADFYGLPRNKEFITLEKETWQVPSEIVVSDSKKIVPFWANQKLNWRCK
jgi:dihydroorotase